MRRRRTLSRKDRRAFDRLVRMFYEFEARDPAAGETGPPIRRMLGSSPTPRPLRRRGEAL
jgi:hypothetical protein